MKKTAVAVAVAAVVGLSSAAYSAEQDAACKLTIRKADNAVIIAPYKLKGIGDISDVIKSGSVGKMSVKAGVLDNLRVEDIQEMQTVCELVDGTRIESVIILQHNAAEDTRG